MKKLHNNVVYTALFGNYDTLAPVNPDWHCDFICFTDDPGKIPDSWQIQIVPLENNHPAILNRCYKMLPHKFLDQYECSLYIDSNIKIIRDPNPLFNKYLSSSIIALPLHQDRDCVYDEALACVKHRKSDKEDTIKLLEHYKKMGFPKKYGLTENNVILRKHHEIALVSLMNEWWIEYGKSAKRDQLTLPYLIWKHNINYLELIEGPRISNKYFKINLHNHDIEKPLINKIIQRSIINKNVSAGYYLIASIASWFLYIKNAIRRRLN